MNILLSYVYKKPGFMSQIGFFLFRQKFKKLYLDLVFLDSVFVRRGRIRFNVKYIFLWNTDISVFEFLLFLTSGTHQTNLYLLFLWKHIFVGPDPKVAYVSAFQSIRFLEEKEWGMDS